MSSTSAVNWFKILGLLGAAAVVAYKRPKILSHAARKTHISKYSCEVFESLNHRGVKLSQRGVTLLKPPAMTDALDLLRLVASSAREFLTPVQL
jgi:hypothetical protein